MAGTVIEEIPLGEPLPELMSRPAGAETRLFWLGQAGFVLETGGRRLIIDPYLSDTLAEKYRGTPRPHIRMMQPPVAPSDIRHVDAVLCTHAHTDHMDPGTLKPLLGANPQARLIAPRAMLAQAIERSGLVEARITTIDAAETIEIDDIRIIATRAAHETLERDAEGYYKFLGYMIDADGKRIWHSGDCIPFDGQVPEVLALDPDIALLPCNGRRPELSLNGVPGNFTIDEAVELARDIGAGSAILNHYGLFDFNTEDPAAIDKAAGATTALNVMRARLGIGYRLRPAI